MCLMFGANAPCKELQTILVMGQVTGAERVAVVKVCFDTYHDFRSIRVAANF